MTYGYDTANRRTSMTDPTGQTVYSYDRLDRVITATLPVNRAVAYQYDAAGNRTRITYPDGKAVNYTYDDANRLSAVTDWITNTTSYSYDPAGRLITTTLPTGVTEARGYNAADQLSSILATKGGNTLTSFSYTLDDAGLRTAVQDLAGTESYGYDKLYRTTAVTYTDSITQTYSYDAVGNRLSKLDPSSTITSTYDNGDRLTASTGITYTYDSNGNQRGRTSGGATTSYCWDVFNRLVGATESQSAPSCPVDPVRLNSGGGAYVDGGGKNWAPDTFSTGGVTASTPAPIGGTTDDPLYQAYRYGTAANPMAYAIPLATPGAYSVTLKFMEPTKTAAGQRKFDVTLEGTLVLDDFDVYSAGGKNNAVDRSFAVTVTDGILNAGFSQVVYNPIISAIQVLWAGPASATPLVTYTYRGDGLRSTKTVTTTPAITYTWDLNSGLPEVLQDGSLTYVYGLGGLVSQTDITGTQTYFLGNGLGSTEALTDGSGNIAATYKYDVFGAVRGSTGSGSTEYRFNGQEDDAALGYTYLRARYYEPATGRFLSKDPFPGVLANPASLHYYAYAQNNPANFTDPSGNCPMCLVAVPFVVPAAGAGLAAALPWIVLGVGTIAAGAAAVVRWDDISALGASCLEQQGQYLEENGSIFYAQREKGELDQIARERKLIPKQRDRLGRAVENYKDSAEIPNWEKLPRREIERIADEEGLDNR